MNKDIQAKCIELRKAYEAGLLGNQTMPEDTQPEFNSEEERLSYFTLPMSLNYQRNSYALWASAKESFNDSGTKTTFSVNSVSQMGQDELRPLLMKYKIALQPNKHTNTWHSIASVVAEEWGSIENMLASVDYDFLKLQNLIQVTHKKRFPYLSGPKIFHYWSYILGEYCGILLKNKEFIQIAPDTHVIQCSILLGVLTEEEAKRMKREDISARWREILEGSGLSPSDMHSPLWFWSRNNFSFKLVD